jgi:hypothetical protein
VKNCSKVVCCSLTLPSCQETDQALLKGIEVGPQVARGARVDKPALGDHADLIAQAADLVRLVATEESRDVLIHCKATKEVPHLPLGWVASI